MMDQYMGILVIPDVHPNSSVNGSGSGTESSNSTFPTGTDEGQILLEILGAKRKELRFVVLLIVIYSVVFVTGIVGNVCTCVVIAKNAYMRTATNYYLFSLAMSDIFTLLF
ncbi:neuromedin-U receptor 1, partial [Biomphalaria glabrata]